MQSINKTIPFESGDKGENIFLDFLQFWLKQNFLHIKKVIEDPLEQFLLGGPELGVVSVKTDLFKEESQWSSPPPGGCSKFGLGK